jgi:hypothetical protein
MRIRSAACRFALAALCVPLAPPRPAAARAHGDTAGRASRPAAQQPASQAAAPQVDQWGDEFEGSALDETKWERYTFEGGGGGKLEVSGGQLRIRGANKTRAGVRSKPTFTSDHFSVEAVVSKVGPQLPEAGDRSSPIGFAALTLLFDGSGRNRVEWIFTSEHTLEAWSVVDGRGERLDNRKLGLKFDRPVLAVVRRGDEFLFVVNRSDGAPQDAQIALQKTIKNMPRSFRVMLYGFGSSQNEWDSARVVTAK